MKLDLHARALYPRARESFEQSEAPVNPCPRWGVGVPHTRSVTTGRQAATASTTTGDGDLNQCPRRRRNR
jgi:hypothetical protein